MDKNIGVLIDFVFLLFTIENDTYYVLRLLFFITLFYYNLFTVGLLFLTDFYGSFVCFL